VLVKLKNGSLPHLKRDFRRKFQRKEVSRKNRVVGGRIKYRRMQSPCSIYKIGNRWYQIELESENGEAMTRILATTLAHRHSVKFAVLVLAGCCFNGSSRNPCKFLDVRKLCAVVHKPHLGSGKEHVVN